MVGGGVGLAVDVAAVTDGQGEDDEAVIVECAYEAVVADAVPPQSGKITGEGFTVLAGVSGVVDVFRDPAVDEFLGVAVQFFKFFIESAGGFELPAHRSHSSHSSLMGRDW